MKRKHKESIITARSIMDDLSYDALKEALRDIDKLEADDELHARSIEEVIENALTSLIDNIEERLADIHDANLDASSCPWLANTLALFIHEVNSPHDKLQIADDLAEVFAELKGYCGRIQC